MVVEVPELAVVVPVHDERDNVEPLIDETVGALRGRYRFEIVYVDDASRDDTLDRLRATMSRVPELRVVRHLTQCGQSTAVRNGVKAARAPWIATLDGDGQNDPAFIPELVSALDRAGPGIGLVAGQRLRRVGGYKKMQSRIANAVRGAVLKDGTRDTGCGLKAFRRETYLALPYFDALHRFMPALVKREGLGVAHVDVVDRPRLAGQSNYGMFDRLWVGILDLAGVWWLIRRRRRVARSEELS